MTHWSEKMKQANPSLLIDELIGYALKKKLIEEGDRAYATGSLIYTLRLSSYEPTTVEEERPLCEILTDVCDYAYENGLIENNSTVYYDLFDTEVMGRLVARPSEVTARFYSLYEKSPEKATDYFYSLACDSNYIRTDRIERDVKWQAPSAYGAIDISINLSKPEKDPVAIARAKNLPQAGYPKCALCRENEGHPGSLSKPARQNIRLIPFEMGGERWFLQYSPYVYYNEHCIALAEKHTPMKIDRSSFEKLLGFVTLFPHYFIGSNADLPIVGGSILAHDHMQGGRYSFAMESASVEIPLCFEGYPQVDAGILHWPMSVIRLYSTDKEALVSLADKILAAWRGYSDPSVDIYAVTDGTPHNTITPIARRRGEGYELDLVLRNNRATEEHPLGLFHPHADKHNIKKENIGLIEVMGLAVLPSRLKSELESIRLAILEGKNIAEIPEISSHASWVDSFIGKYKFTQDNIEQILRDEVGNTFVRVLEDAGVYKTSEEGREAFMRFVLSIGGRRK